MNRALLTIAAPALLLALGLAQTPAASSNTDQTIKGCLAGSAGNYTVVEDNTGHIFKITTNSVDFKQHLGHDVTLIGRRASEAGSASADHSFAVTELNMISGHCAAAAPIAAVGTPTAETTAPVATTSSTVADNTITPDAPPPAATASTPPATGGSPTVADAPVLATSSTITDNAVLPDAPFSLPAEKITPLDAVATAPAVDVSTPWDRPAADAGRTRLPIRSRRTPEPAGASATTVAMAAIPSPETAGTSDATATPTPVATAATSSESASTADRAATPAAPARRGALWLLITLAVLVIVVGTLVPLLSKWRKRKSLERTGMPNLSFTREASSEQSKSEQPGPRKAA